ncbi:AAA family ATPase [Flavobacterium azooxidireducens]|uniref:AAA family ATPase n=1 Tax=Flavobacterium azooxidireducens TaxID=1871076 RepID=A0ABY4KFZ7_9FLAO|nr:AAA family ATPase [Flavobacterium azooxidireducens]UPQ79727.1 AAA family ATPase [Flavobacterium azooxidireducens]
MYISELKLWNFRKYGSNESFDLNNPDLIVPFTKGLNVLIGENDSGKSAILDAIKLALKTHAYEWIKVENEDFYFNENRLRIEIEFKDLKDNEAKNFIEWLGWAKENGIDIPVLRLIYDVSKDKDGKVLPTDIKAGMDDIGYPLNAEARDYLKCTYLKALRDANSDLTSKKNSRLSQILQEHKLFKKGKNNEEHIFVEKFKKINEEIENWFKDDKATDDLSKSNKEEIKDKIDEFLKKFIDNKYESIFSLGKAEIKNILEKISLGIEKETNLGLGTMNRLYMSAELLHLKKENWDGLRLCMIEELEAHLHPQAQMKIIDALKEKEGEETIQYILTTHSPNIASKVSLKSLIICKDNKVFPMGEGKTKLDSKDYVYLERFLDVTKSNLFFAKGVIIVEGWSEEILIPAIARKIGYELTEKEVSIVNVASIAYLHFAKIFLREDKEEKMKIPVSIVTDLDNRPEKDGSFIAFDKLEGKAKTKYDNLKKQKEDYKSTNIKLELAEQWTLEWCLYNSANLSALFKESLKNVHPTIFKSSFDDFIPMLKKEKTTNLEKVKIATDLAEKIEKSTTLVIDEKDIHIKYLVDAIKHACSYEN